MTDQMHTKLITYSVFVPEMTYYVSSGTLNLAQLNCSETRRPGRAVEVGFKNLGFKVF